MRVCSVLRLGLSIAGHRIAPRELIIRVIPGRLHRVRAKRVPMTGSEANYGAQLRT
jgi:hypothetical protein